MSRITTLVLAALLLAFTPLVSVAGLLSTDDCDKCHLEQPAQIAEKGASHKTEINCQDCHTGHRPISSNNIPQCSMCHSGKSHYELENCLRCHNPHQPLAVKLEGELKAECLTCHEVPGSQMVANPSKHAEQSCNFCHADKHGVIPQCVDCHEPHSEQITQADCANCHQPHQPTLLTYGDDTPSVQCAACHDDVYGMLNASQAKHSALDCATCHQGKHKMVPQCTDCHGTPHPEGIHAKFPQCGTCHNIAHDLNNWPAK